MLHRNVVVASMLVSLALDAHFPSLNDTAHIAPNDNRIAAGTLSNGVLTIDLEAATGTWYPEGENGAAIETAGWREAGKPMQTPGPLIRVTVGTHVKAKVHNTLAKLLTVYGFAKVRGLKDSVVVAPGATSTMEFDATTPGTYYYAGQTVAGPILARLNEDSQLNGVIIVDPVGAARPDDRIFVISWWFLGDSTSPSGIKRGTMSLNGLSWPHTQQVDLVQNDSAHWRVVNLTSSDHPMHLHGFYFRIDGRGDGASYKSYAAADQQMAVTEIANPYETFSLSWSPTRPGNWIWHCHFAGHLSHHVAMDTERGMAHAEAESHHMADAPHQMYGLVIGIHVKARGEVTLAGASPRKLRLLMRERDSVYGVHPGYSFVLGGSADERNTRTMRVPGPMLVLERGQPVAITLVNQSKDREAVHWHGIELDSYPDGVPMWSGSGHDILPAIAAGDSLTVRFTPPRAGTFMYHSHFNEFQQITSGLYGPIVVLEPGQHFDPQVDKVLMVTDGGPTTNLITGPFPPMFLNGSADPAPLELKAGVRYRFRVIALTGDRTVQLSIANGASPVDWRMIARDGMTLPASQATTRPAALKFEPGQIYDFEYTPKTRGELTLTYGAPPDPADPGYKPKAVAVHVR